LDGRGARLRAATLAALITLVPGGTAAMLAPVEQLPAIEQQPPARRSRVSRLIRWLLGIACTAALLAAITVYALPAIVFLHWSTMGDEREDQRLDFERRQAIAAEGQLRAAALDGKLTDAELERSLGGNWALARDQRTVRVTTALQATRGPYPEPCYTLVLTLPLGSTTLASHVVSPSCAIGHDYRPPVPTASAG
jgi:hypothetical protein